MTSYDEVPYRSLPFPQTHPDRISVIARLLGHQAPPADRCRVLELGCAAGGNLIPMALALPGSTFLGVDLSARQVDEGRQTIHELHLDNIELRALDLAHIGAELGHFDYIIAHGVYSWVPEEVKAALLRICHDNLSSRGVAYVSYNVYPGWHMRGMIRDMMRYHSGRFADPQTRIGQARALLNFLAKSTPPESSAYGMLLSVEADMMSKQPDHYILHEHLEDTNEPLYFHEFMANAHSNGLHYLGEADFVSMTGSNVRPEVARGLSQVSFDVISYEQYLDFATNRTFRQTLLVRQDIKTRRALNVGDVRDLYVGTRVKPVSDIRQPGKPGLEEFSGSSKSTPIVKSSDPLVKAALRELAEAHPLPLHFRELLVRARKRRLSEYSREKDIDPDDDKRLATMVAQGFSIGSIELQQLAPRFVLAPGAKPRANSLARLQARDSVHVTNCQHRVAGLTSLQRRVLALLNGTLDHAQLTQALMEGLDSDSSVLEGLNLPASPSARRRAIDELIEKTLHSLARFALIEE